MTKSSSLVAKLQSEGVVQVQKRDLYNKGISSRRTSNHHSWLFIEADCHVQGEGAIVI
jgi:hypothetical protein